MPTIQDTQVGSLGQADPLDKVMATHSDIRTWIIPWTEEPGGLHSPWSYKESDMTKRLSMYAYAGIMQTLPHP